MPVAQLVNYRYTVVQLRPKRSLLHSRFTHTPVRNEKFLAFSQSDLSVSILTSSPLLSCHSGSASATAEYDVISIFQDGGRGRSLVLPASYLLMSLPSEGQNLSTNQISSTSMVNIYQFMAEI